MGTSELKTLLSVSFLFQVTLAFCQQEAKAIELCDRFIHNGKSITENRKAEGQKTGYWSYYFDDKNDASNDPNNAFSIFIVNYEAGIPKGICVMCYTSSKLLGFGTYKADTTWTEEGVFKWYDKNGTLYLEETYANGMLNGTTKEHYKSGKIRLESFYTNDTLTKMNNYRKDGTLIGTKEFSYTPDTVVVLNLYRKDKSRIVFERQVNGKDDGDYFIYFRDGSLKLEAKNVKGVRVYERMYNKDGKLKKESTCSPDGTNCWVKIYNKNGQVKREGPFKHEIKYKWEF